MVRPKQVSKHIFSFPLVPFRHCALRLDLRFAGPGPRTAGNGVELPRLSCSASVLHANGADHLRLILCDRLLLPPPVSVPVALHAFTLFGTLVPTTISDNSVTDVHSSPLGSLHGLPHSVVCPSLFSLSSPTDGCSSPPSSPPRHPSVLLPPGFSIIIIVYR